jgi:hypothetical protein
MKTSLAWAAVLALAFLSAPLAAIAASSPAPAPSGKPVVLPTPNYPKKALRAQLQVEVNKKGQVVRVLHGDMSGDKAFDTMVLGNAMQMWIRHPDGSAQVGLYRVIYDYDPQTHNVNRTPTLIKAGGDWANKPGAAIQIMKEAQRQAEAYEKKVRAEQDAKEKANAKNLPDINAAVKRSIASPSPSPHP